MKKLRVLLIPAMLLAEVLALALCWLLVLFHMPTARRLTNWFMRVLPDREWFTDGWRMPA